MALTLNAWKRASWKGLIQITRSEKICNPLQFTPKRLSKE